ncbi:MAG: GYD domain-containing protein [Acidimicrobiales bacterium]|nr:GYD domain-containing protein [Acidimicrobiales bacterium]
MPHYMITGSYNADGAKALIAEGGTARLNQARSLIESLGGNLEAFYFAFGEDDIVGFCEMPDDATAAAATLAASSSGTVSIKITPLLTPADIDTASSVVSQATYRAPGN